MPASALVVPAARSLAGQTCTAAVCSHESVLGSEFVTVDAVRFPRVDRCRAGAGGGMSSAPAQVACFLAGTALTPSIRSPDRVFWRELVPMLAVRLQPVGNGERCTQPSFRFRVGGILCGRAKKEVGGVAARRPVAGVTNKQSVWNRPDVEFVAVAMGVCDVAVPQVKLAVAGGSFAGSPQPAVAWGATCDLRPKAFFGVRVPERRSHGANIPRNRN